MLTPIANCLLYSGSKKYSETSKYVPPFNILVYISGP